MKKTNRHADSSRPTAASSRPAAASSRPAEIPAAASRPTTIPTGDSSRPGTMTEALRELFKGLWRHD